MDEKPVRSKDEARRQYGDQQGQSPSKKEPRDWQALIEERASQIDINTLPGKGKPLNLNRNPYADEADELANSLLRNAGFTLPWIEDSRNIDANLERIRGRLRGAHEEYLDQRDNPICAGHQWVEGSWQAALREFREAVADINREIRDFNLKAPHVNLHKFSIRVDEELARIGVSDEQAS